STSATMRTARSRNSGGYGGWERRVMTPSPQKIKSPDTPGRFSGVGDVLVDEPHQRLCAR
ncbi:hypothetical protein, partial [Pseudonocardia sp. McavD-2-B]|uniref:hypothetical protein n=1 Tax=Pseudonocardia sp. McavD-2-B TaxID=2954499 RepID=UPI002096AD4D